MRSKWAFILLVLLSQATFATGKVFTSRNNKRAAIVSDIDDTFLYLSTKIRLFEKENPDKFLDVTTADFAEFNKGSEKFTGFTTLEDGIHSSFTFFRVKGTPDDKLSYFDDNLKEAMSKSKTNWQGPYFWRVIENLKTPEGAKMTYFLTARGHAPHEVMIGLTRLQKFLKKKYAIQIFLPPEENFLLVDAGAKSPERKGEEFVKIVQAQLSQGQDVIEFADDDTKNIAAVRAAVLASTPLVTSAEITIRHVSPAGDDVEVYKDGAQINKCFEALKVDAPA
jgi:hypothetical protein